MPKLISKPDFWGYDLGTYPTVFELVFDTHIASFSPTLFMFELHFNAHFSWYVGWYTVLLSRIMTFICLDLHMAG